MTTELLAPQLQPDTRLLESGLRFAPVACTLTFVATADDVLAKRHVLSWSAFTGAPGQVAAGGAALARALGQPALTLTF